MQTYEHCIYHSDKIEHDLVSTADCKAHVVEDAIDKNVVDVFIIVREIQMKNRNKTRYALYDEEIVSQIAPFGAENAKDGAGNLDDTQEISHPRRERIKQLSIIFTVALLRDLFTTLYLLTEPTSVLQ